MSGPLVTGADSVSLPVVATALQQLRSVHADLVGVLETIRGQHAQRLRERAGEVHRSMETGLEGGNGSHASTSISLLGLIAECQNVRWQSDQNGISM